jgi:hypothetical protein
MKTTEQPPQVIKQQHQGDEQPAPQGVGSTCYVFNVTLPALNQISMPLVSATPLPEIPKSFEAALKDIQEGRVIDLDVALNQTPRASAKVHCY